METHPPIPRPSRRDFVAAVVPGCCALGCLGFPGASGLASLAAAPFRQAKKAHKFDADLDRKLTYRQMFGLQYGDAIRLARAVEGAIGKDALLAALKKATSERMTRFGEMQAKQAGDTSLGAYVRQFKDPQAYESTLTMEIVEDTERAFEMRVTECLWATTFRNANAGDLGEAWVCHGDHGWAAGFNPRIRLVRDKTLMHGDACCNHRYVLEQ